MKTVDRYSKTPAFVVKTWPASRVQTAGYVPIAKRIDSMVRAGVQLQNTPTFYQFQDGKIPEKFETVNSVHNDVYDNLTRQRVVESRISDLASKASQDASEQALNAIKRSAVEEYLKTHASPVAPPSGASTEASKL